jgi:hypothetical protein
MIFSKCDILLDSTFILKSYHNFESYQNMLITLGFCVLYHKLQKQSVCLAHYTPFTCGKGLLKILNFQKYLKFLKFSNSISFKL